MAIYDELEEEFNLGFYLEFLKDMEELKDEEEYGNKYWNDMIDYFYKLWKDDKKKLWANIGNNDIEAHFIFYCLYKLVKNDEKALKHVEHAHTFYIRNTVPYHWENVAYKALQQTCEDAVLPDCILPNNKKPDLVINPVYSDYKYHPRGTKILRAETIIDIKTSIYSTTKEKQFYKKYCDKLIIVYIKGKKGNNNSDITFISSKELKDKVHSQEIFAEIEMIEKKMEINFILTEFHNRFNGLSNCKI